MNLPCWPHWNQLHVSPSVKPSVINRPRSSHSEWIYIRASMLRLHVHVNPKMEDGTNAHLVYHMLCFRWHSPHLECKLLGKLCTIKHIELMWLLSLLSTQISDIDVLQGWEAGGWRRQQSRNNHNNLARYRTNTKIMATPTTTATTATKKATTWRRLMFYWISNLIANITSRSVA